MIRKIYAHTKEKLNFKENKEISYFLLGCAYNCCNKLWVILFYTRDKVFCVHKHCEGESERERGATLPVITVLYSTHNLLQGKDKIKITIR